VAPEGGAGTPGHFALMDGVYRYQRHIYDLTRKYYLLGRDRLVRELRAAPGETIVEIGCGTARNLIRIAKAYPGVTLYGLDASSEMLRTAEESLKRAGLAGRVVLVHALAEEMTPALFGREQPFDHAIFSYSLSMIPDWRGALAVAAANVRPKGRVHIVDFGDLKALWPPFANALRGWLRLFHVAPRDALLTELEGHSVREDFSLRLLPGRYAFLVHAAPEAILASA
jgi:S-adenosylmethionine-diacylgycerolhomoserine-N-methlytransferase